VPQIMVGNSYTPASWAEYFFSILPKGTPVEWSGYRCGTGIFCKNEAPEKGCGIFLYSWWYDGVIAVIEIGTGKKVSLMLDLSRSTRVKRLKDTKKMSLAGMHGDGI